MIKKGGERPYSFLACGSIDTSTFSSSIITEICEEKKKQICVINW